MNAIFALERKLIKLENMWFNRHNYTYRRVRKELESLAEMLNTTITDMPEVIVNGWASVTPDGETIISMVKDREEIIRQLYNRVYA